MCQSKLFYLFFCQHNGLFLQLRRCDFSKINRKIKTVLQAKLPGIRYRTLRCILRMQSRSYQAPIQNL